MVETAAISSDNSVMLITLNGTVLVDPSLTVNDFQITLTGPRSNMWYPMTYYWTNELALKDTVGENYFTFEPDYSNPIIQFFGENTEYFDITFLQQHKIYNSIYGLMYTNPVVHYLINNYAFIGYVSSP
jgi:hypothetical protein